MGRGPVITQPQLLPILRDVKVVSVLPLLVAYP